MISEQHFLVNPHLHGKDPQDSAYPLVCHLLDTMIVADLLWQTRVRDGLKRRLARCFDPVGGGTTSAEQFVHAAVLLAAGLHDLGKINPFFQYQERFSGDLAWRNLLQDTLNLPKTSESIAQHLRAHPRHALRRHEFWSYRGFVGEWANEDSALAGKNWLGVVLAGHHGFWRAIQAHEKGLADRMLGADWEREQQAALALVNSVVHQLTGIGYKELPALTAPEAAVMVACLSGLVVQADWMASDQLVVSVGKKLVAGGHSPGRDLASAQGWIDLRRDELAELARLSLGSKQQLNRAQLTGSIMGDFDLRPLQVQAVSLGSDGRPEEGLWVVMYPTGDGKTEAAGLRHALAPDEGLLFGLPTRASTDAMEARISRWLNPLGAELVKSHQFAELFRDGNHPTDSDDEDENCGSSSWFTSSLRKLAAPNLVATCDQVLAAALEQKHIMMRLFNLANHHVVLDEVHTMDTYQTELLIELLNWWGATRTRVTLLSATLPSKQLERLVRAYRGGAGLTEQEAIPQALFPGALFAPADPAQALSFDRPVEAKRRYLPPAHIEVEQFRNGADRVKSHCEWAAKTVRACPASPIGIIVNTVNECIEIAQSLLEDEEVTATHEVICLHSRMVAVHRTAVEERVRDGLGKSARERGFDPTNPERRPLLVVGTQVIQASLDIDFDHLATDLAPAPDIIQRLGRQWRFVADEQSAASRAQQGGLPTRTLRLAAVTDAEGQVTSAGARPYLVSTLSNTLNWLIRYQTANPGEPTDLMQVSQEWVDAAFEQRLLSELLEDPGEVAKDRILQDLKHTLAAEQAKARLASSHDAGLLRPSKTGGWVADSGADWADLCALTSMDVDELRMRTRFIDRDSESVILFDHLGSVGNLDTSGCRLPSSPPADLAEIPPTQAAEFMRFSIPLPFGLAESIESAARETLGQGEAWSRKDWSPAARVLGSLLPVDINYLEGCHYDPQLGLVLHKKENR